MGLLSLLLASGCGSLAAPQVAPPNVDPSAAATEAVQVYDSSGDGALDESELAACPAIQDARDRYDVDGDRRVSEEEIAQGLERIYSSGVGLLEVQCTVTRGGRPLSGATVRMVPEPFLGDAIQTAVATTDVGGLAIPSVPTDQLPQSLRKMSMMQVGLYRVEIEHPSITLGSVKPLGLEVDPTRRDGMTARFDL